MVFESNSCSLTHTLMLLRTFTSAPYKHLVLFVMPVLSGLALRAAAHWIIYSRLQHFTQALYIVNAQQKT